VSELIKVVAAEFDLGPIEEISRPPTGAMNETYLVRAGGRRVVVRRHRRLERARVEREHDIMAYAMRRGIPVPAALCTPSGDRLLQYDGKWHSVFAFAPGVQVNSVDADHAYSMGVMLARTHEALADFPVEPVVRQQPAIAHSLLLVRRIQVAIRPDTAEDRAAIAYLDSKVAAIRDGVVPPPPIESQQMVHGDYQHTNLFFDGDRIVAVIDWDKAESRVPTAEIVRTMDLSLHLDPKLCAAFIDGYRQVRRLDPAALDSAAVSYDFDIRHDLWVHTMIYLHDDQRLRQFLRPPPFVPFIERWAKVRESLPLQ
jgi:homoserine kinase type II